MAVAVLGLWVLLAAIILPGFVQLSGRTLSWFECVVVADAVFELGCGIIRGYRWLEKEAATFRF